MSWHPNGYPRPHETNGNETEHSNEEENEELDDDCYVYDDAEAILPEEKKKLPMNEAMEEEHVRCQRWIECRLVSTIIQSTTGKEFKCLCHDENERKRFHASPEYLKYFKEEIGMNIEELGAGITFEAVEVDDLGEHQE